MSRLDDYRQYREVGTELNSAIIDEYVDRDVLLESADMLGFDLGEEDAAGMTPMFYDSPDEMNIHMDFIVHEYRLDGKTPSQLYLENDRWESETEREILEAHQRAYTSLFEIDAVDEAESRLYLTDLLNDEPDRSITDRGLSSTATPGVLLFFRYVPLEEFAMTSGVSFPFHGDLAETLIDTYETIAERVDRPEPVTRYLAFFRLKREYGVDIGYL